MFINKNQSSYCTITKFKMMNTIKNIRYWNIQNKKLIITQFYALDVFFISTIITCSISYRINISLKIAFFQNYNY